MDEIILPAQQMPMRTGRLFLGDYLASSHEEKVTSLIERNVTYILSLGFEVSPFELFQHSVAQAYSFQGPAQACGCQGSAQAYSFHCYAWSIEDNPQVWRQMKSLLPDIVELLHSLLSSGHNVYVHCHAGISRSATVVIYYLMRYHGLSYSTARGLVQCYRPIICPNSGFAQALQELA